MVILDVVQMVKGSFQAVNQLNQPSTQATALLSFKFNLSLMASIDELLRQRHRNNLLIIIVYIKKELSCIQITLVNRF